MRGIVSFAARGCAALFLLAAAGSASAGEAPASPKASILFTKLEQRLPEGETYLYVQRGLNCDGYRQVKVKGNGTGDVTGLVRARLNRELRDSGFNTDAPTTSGFNGGPSRIFQLSGVVRRLTIRACFGRNTIESRADVEIAWELYSVAERSVVVRITTEAISRGSFDARDANSAGEIEDIGTDKVYGIEGAVAANLRDLVSHPNLRKALLAEPDPTNLQPAASMVRISAPTAPPSPRTVAQAATGVVLIVTAGGHGSGVLVSSDGYILTNEHVVDRAKTVTVRWSDRTETQGEVVRAHKGRDVALIKTDAKRHVPLALRTEMVELGEPVMAIGAPLDQELQGTVTRGIVSTPVRKFQGFNFIQSDVSVAPGNSGGPLIDDKSRVVGLTDLGVYVQQTDSLSLFIPIKEALDFVGLDVTAPTPPAGPVARPRPVARPAASRRR